MGILCEKYGGKVVILYALGLCVVITAISPVVAQFAFWISVVMRFAIGFVSGGIYPALHKLMSKWAPPEEKGKFTSALVGGAIGTVTTWALAGWLIETIGWDFGFYVPAILVAAFTIVWYLVVFDMPRQHPRIGTDEKEFIERTLVGITPTKVG